MIEYIRTVLDDRPGICARSDIDIGAATRSITVALGPWARGDPDPGGPLGLASTPVVVVPDDRLADVAEAGARRAGRDAAISRLGARPAIGLDLLAAEADVLLVPGGGIEALRVARVLRGHPVAALPLGDPRAIDALIAGLDVDVHIPLPSIEGADRERMWQIVERFDLASMHHVVEVDPMPALAERAIDVTDVGIEALAAAAAGVLAGRLAAGNRRWRSQLAD